MRCPGSLLLEEKLPDTSSVYADEGTAAGDDTTPQFTRISDDSAAA
jgi:hypothetical protein